MRKPSLLICLALFLIVSSVFIGCAEEQPNNENITPEKEKDSSIKENVKNIKDVNKVDEIIETINTSDETILMQSYEPDRSTDLGEDKVNTLIKLIESLELYNMPNPYGTSYPGYEIVLYQNNKELLTLKILDSAYVKISSKNNYIYLESTEEIWDTIEHWLPMKKTTPGSVENLYKAERVEVIIDDESSRIEFDASFRVTNLVNILKSADIKEVSEPSNTNRQAKLIFYFDNHEEKVKIYENHALYEGTLLKKEDIGNTIVYNIRAG